MPFRLSTRGHYAVLVMYELARAKDAYCSLQEISNTQKLSQGYLEQIVRPLREAGLVKSKGFRRRLYLGKTCGRLTVGEIVRAVEGPVVPVKCVADDSQPDACPEDCKARAVWQRVGAAIDNVLDSITLGDLVDEGAKTSPVSEGETDRDN